MHLAAALELVVIDSVPEVHLDRLGTALASAPRSTKLTVRHSRSLNFTLPSQDGSDSFTLLTERQNHCADTTDSFV